MLYPNIVIQKSFTRIYRTGVQRCISHVNLLCLDRAWTNDSEEELDHMCFVQGVLLRCIFLSYIKSSIILFRLSSSPIIAWLPVGYQGLFISICKIKLLLFTLLLLLLLLLLL